MRVLLVHPEDSPRRGAWTGQRWDLVVDLGISSAFSKSAWEEQFHCPVLGRDLHRHGVEDLKRTRRLLSIGLGRLLDEEGTDWWELTSLLIADEAEAVIVLQSLASEIGQSGELWATRSDWPVNAVAALAGCPVQILRRNPWIRLAGPAARYARLFRHFSARQIKEIFLDKYDSGYEWRTRFAPRAAAFTEPVILLPSAYSNVSRVAASYARLLPRQSFLLVSTRDSATQFQPQPNVIVRHLASYVSPDPLKRQIESLLDGWKILKKDLCDVREFEILSKTGVLDSFEDWFPNCLRAGNAWRKVLEQEPVQAVMCGDDSNIYTRLPVALALKRQIPTVDFHHGALDGRYLLKNLVSDLYLAKNEMERDYLLRVCGLAAERVVVGAPPVAEASARESSGDASNRKSAILFSEPYDVAGMRAEEVYRELLPPLCRLARENGRSLIIKLHPFESLAQRERIVREVLSPDDHNVVQVVDGPLTPELMSQAWFGITVESTTAIDCLQNGVCCFLCGWLSLGPYEYARQYARFGIGEVLEDAGKITEIPNRLTKLQTPLLKVDLSPTVDPATLQRWLTAPRVSDGARSDS